MQRDERETERVCVVTGMGFHKTNAEHSTHRTRYRIRTVTLGIDRHTYTLALSLSGSTHSLLIGPCDC